MKINVSYSGIETKTQKLVRRARKLSTTSGHLRSLYTKQRYWISLVYTLSF